jgi:hypothetical protein
MDWPGLFRGRLWVCQQVDHAAVFAPATGGRFGLARNYVYRPSRRFCKDRWRLTGFQVSGFRAFFQNSKKQTPNNKQAQCPKFQGIDRRTIIYSGKRNLASIIGLWNLEFVWYLMLGIWEF